MAAKKTALPSINVNKDTHPVLVATAAEALNVRSQLTDLTTREEQLKTNLKADTDAIRLNEQAKGNYIGLVKITDPSQAAVQVQYKITGGALDLDQAEALDHFYGSARTLLFEKDLVVTNITDPAALIAEIIARGQNPWDFLDIKVKKGLDRAFIDSPNVTKVEAFLPKEGFLATTNEVFDTFTEKTVEYHNNYLATVLKPVVTLGSK